VVFHDYFCRAERKATTCFSNGKLFDHGPDIPERLYKLVSRGRIEIVCTSPILKRPNFNSPAMTITSREQWRSALSDYDPVQF
jgi:hypothetical protein